MATERKADEIFTEALYKRDAITAAYDLGYAEEYIQRIREAKTMNEISRIMVDARHAKFGEE